MKEGAAVGSGAVKGERNSEFKVLRVLTWVIGVPLIVAYVVAGFMGRTVGEEAVTIFLALSGASAVYTGMRPLKKVAERLSKLGKEEA